MQLDREADWAAAGPDTDSGDVVEKDLVMARIVRGVERSLPWEIVGSNREPGPTVDEISRSNWVREGTDDRARVLVVG